MKADVLELVLFFWDVLVDLMEVVDFLNVVVLGMMGFALEEDVVFVLCLMRVV
jgi:hypothetical protein